MKAFELAALLLALPPDQQQLEVMHEDEIYIDPVDAPRLTYLDENGKESLDDFGRVVKTDCPIIALWTNAYDEDKENSSTDDTDEWIDGTTPTAAGWYAVLYSYDANEWTFADAVYFNSKNWSRDLPIFQYFGPFLLEENAKAWAKKHDPQC